MLSVGSGEGLRGELDLDGWFVRRMHLSARGKRVQNSAYRVELNGQRQLRMNIASRSGVAPLWAVLPRRSTEIKIVAF